MTRCRGSVQKFYLAHDSISSMNGRGEFGSLYPAISIVRILSKESIGASGASTSPNKGFHRGARLAGSGIRQPRPKIIERNNWICPALQVYIIFLHTKKFERLAV